MIRFFCVPWLCLLLGLSSVYALNEDSLSQNPYSLKLEEIEEIDVYKVNLIQEEPLTILSDDSVILAQAIEFDLSNQKCESFERRSVSALGRLSCYFKIEVPFHTEVIGISPATDPQRTPGYFKENRVFPQRGVNDEKHTKKYVFSVFKQDDFLKDFLEVALTEGPEGSYYMIVVVSVTQRISVINQESFRETLLKLIGKVRLTVSGPEIKSSES